MSADVLEIYTAKVFADKSGVPYDSLRNWRRDGYLEGVGRQGKTGRWRYGPSDLITVRLATMFASSGVELPAAFLFARNVQPSAIGALSGFPKTSPDGFKWRYFVFFDTGEGITPADRWKLGQWDERGLSLGNLIWPISFLVDLEATLNHLPPDITQEFLSFFQPRDAD